MQLIGKLAYFPLRSGVTSEGHKSEPVAEAGAGTHLGIPTHGKVNPSQFLRNASLESLLVKPLLILVYEPKFTLIGDSSVLIQLVGTLDRAGLFVGFAVDQQSLNGWDIVEIRDGRVPTAQLVVGLCAVTMPLPEDEDGSLDLDDAAGHLEWRHVLVFVEIPEKLFVTWRIDCDAETPAYIASSLFVRISVRITPGSTLSLTLASIAYFLFAPSEEPLLGRHAGGFDDSLIRAPRLDELDVTVIENLDHLVVRRFLYVTGGGVFFCPTDPMISAT